MKFHFLFFFSLCFLQSVIAQETSENNLKKEQPPFKLTRAEESYTFLKNKEVNPFEANPFDAIKYIYLSKSGNTYLTTVALELPSIIFDYFYLL